MSEEAARSSLGRRCAVRALVAFALCVLASACASLDLGPRDLGQREWIEVEVGPFRMVSELGREDTLRLLEELDVFRRVASQLLGLEEASPSAPIRIFALGDEAYAAFGPPGTGGYFSSTARGLFIALDGQARIEARGIIYHEYTHYLLAQSRALSYPRWYDEGLAEVLRGTQVRGEGAIVGLPLEDRLAELKTYGRKDVTSVVLPYSSQFGSMSSTFYATSWLLVHYLQFGIGQGFPDRRQQLLECLKLLDRGVEARQAFETAFGMSLAQLDAELSAYAKAGKMSFFPVKLPLRPRSTPSVRILDAGSALAALGDLALHTGNRTRAAAVYRAALRLLPDDPRLLASLARSVPTNEFERRHPLAERALQLGAADPMVQSEAAFAWLEELELDPPERPRRKGSEPAALPLDQRPDVYRQALRHFERALQSCVDCGEVEFGIGSLLLLPEGDAVAARMHLERAAGALPADLFIEFQLARAYLRTGSADLARRLLQRQMQRAHETSWMPRVARSLAEAEAALDGKASADPAPLSR